MKMPIAALFALGASTLVACDDNEPIGEDTLEEIEDAADDVEDTADEIVDDSQ